MKQQIGTSDFLKAWDKYKGDFADVYDIVRTDAINAIDFVRFIKDNCYKCFCDGWEINDFRFGGYRKKGIFENVKFDRNVRFYRCWFYPTNKFFKDIDVEYLLYVEPYDDNRTGMDEFIDYLKKFDAGKAVGISW